MSPDLIKAYTQSILALVVVVGAGLLMAFTNLDAEIFIGVVGVVLGYFFGSSVPPAPLHNRG